MRQDLWAYQFHSFEPNEQGRVPMECFLKANLSNLTGTNQDIYRRHIKKVCESFGDNDPGINLHEFIAFQYIWENQDALKAKLTKYRFLDYVSYLDFVSETFSESDYCRKNKIVINEQAARVLFCFLDTDESGELEPEELYLFNRMLLGQSKDEKAKEDLKVLFDKFCTTLRGMLSTITQGLF